MTEKEKMLQGLLYDAAYDKQLEADRERAADLCFDFNQTRPSDTEKREEILRSLIGKLGSYSGAAGPIWFDYGYNIETGDYFCANHNLVILDCAKVTFGDHVFIGPDCGFYTAGHPIDTKRRNQGLEFAHPITVGDNVWFGGGVRVMPGVRIGSNVVIAAGSVVTKDIPDNVIAGGVPCRVIREITEEDEARTYMMRKE